MWRRDPALAIFASYIGAVILIIGGCIAYAVAQGLPATGFTPANPSVQCGTGGAHMCTGGLPPAVTSCGTNASVVGTDVNGSVVTGATATACTLTFATPFNSKPSCGVDGETNVPSYTTTQTQLLLTAVVAGVRYTWQCIGQPGG